MKLVVVQRQRIISSASASWSGYHHRPALSHHQQPFFVQRHGPSFSASIWPVAIVIVQRPSSSTSIELYSICILLYRSTFNIPVSSCILWFDTSMYQSAYVSNAVWYIGIPNAVWHIVHWMQLDTVICWIARYSGISDTARYHPVSNVAWYSSIHLYVEPQVVELQVVELQHFIVDNTSRPHLLRLRIRDDR